MSDDILTRNENEELAVRVVSTTGDTGTNPNDVYTRDENGKLCVRVTGAGGGDQHNLGYYATLSDLQTAHPTAEAGDWAIVGATDTVWIWDTDTNAWVDSDQKGQVTSVNNQTGAVVLDAEDVGALPADTPIPDPQVNSDWNATSGVAEILNKPTLGTAAGADTTDFATASQGAKADTAVQPEDLATVATTGDYDDLLNKPVIPQAGVPQYTTMPTPSASNLGEVAQYSGETVPESATITQTVGSGLTNLAVALEDFVAEEQPMGDETVEFTVTVVAPHVESRVVNGYTEFQSGTIADFDNVFQTMLGETHDHFYMWCNGITWNFQPDEAAGSGSWFNMTTEQLATAGIILSGQLDPDDEIEITLFRNAIAVWEKDNETVDLASYGITYTGTPSDGDELTVDYVKGITQGYFYLNAPTYSEPTATISQTTGSGLTDLAVDLETFIATEQPAQSESVEFVANVVPAEASLGTQVGVFECSLNSAEYIARLVSTWGNEWWTGTGTKDLYFVYNNGWTICTDSQGSNVLSYGVANTDWGFYVTDISQIQNGDYVPVIYTDGSTTWEKDSQTVDLADYGITYSGTPVDNDVLTVVYTAPVITGYNWNQINVQPAGEGGGSAGIEWKTIVDLPAEYVGSAYSCTPAWTISGGLPDGEYEFYFSTKCNNNTEFPIGEVIFKANVIIDNANNTAYGRLGYVFDGDYQNDVNYVFGNDDKNIWSWFRKNGNDLILYCTEIPFVSYLSDYYHSTLIPECWKMSAFTNVVTGQKYIPTGVLDLNGNAPTYTTQMNGYGLIQKLVNPQQFPYYETQISYPVTYLGTRTVVSNVNYSFAVLSVRHEDSDSELVIKFYGGYGDDAMRVRTQEITKATGIFANCYMATADNKSQMYLMGVDTVTAMTYGDNSYFFFSLGVISIQESFVTLTTIPDATTIFAIPQIGSQGYRLGTIVPSGLGNIIQYTGVTDANYTNGYFYKANGTIISVPESATFTASDSDIAVSVNLNNFASAVRDIWGWNVDYIKNMLNDSPNWGMDYDVDNSQITRLWWQAVGNLENYPDVMSAFSVTYTGSQTGSINNITLTSFYIPAHQEVQNPSWDRVDVQPSGGGSLPSQTGNAGKFLTTNGTNASWANVVTVPATTPTLVVADWSSNTQTITVTGVTATNVVLVSPAPSSASDYASAGIICTAQGTDSLTFTCDTVPTNAIGLSVVIL